MKVWVNVGRDEAIVAGKNVWGWRAVEVDMGSLGREEREYLSRCRPARLMREAGKYLEIMGQDKDAPALEGVVVSEATVEEVIGAIRAAIEIRREEKRISAEKARKEAEEREKVILGILAGDAGGLLRTKARRLEGQGRRDYYKATGEYGVDEYYVHRGYSDPRLDAKYAEAEQIASAKNKEIINDIEAKIEAWKAKDLAEKAEAERVVAAKKAQIEEWVAEKGSENQKKRYEVGLLSESEVVDAIRDEAYRALDGFARYEKMQAADVCTCEEHYNDEGEQTECDVDYEVSKATGATAEEYEALEKIGYEAKKAHPGAIVTMMDHVGTSEDCENRVVRKSAKVEIGIGAFRFSREYAIAV